ncbi:hypothetical protein GIX45_16060 [Erwinia sp. CPCC 100877]|nr:hypothetical protein [Erwinia sp. CPCC 100877]
MDEKTYKIIDFHWSRWSIDYLKNALLKVKRYEMNYSARDYCDLVERCKTFLKNGLESFLEKFEMPLELKKLKSWFERTFSFCEEEIRYFLYDLKRKCGAV